MRRSWLGSVLESWFQHVSHLAFLKKTINESDLFWNSPSGIDESKLIHKSLLAVLDMVLCSTFKIIILQFSLSSLVSSILQSSYIFKILLLASDWDSFITIKTLDGLNAVIMWDNISALSFSSTSDWYLWCKSRGLNCCESRGGLDCCESRRLDCLDSSLTARNKSD